jgi:hypothetical protein
MIDNYYKGQLMRSEKGWAFYNQRREMEDLAEMFGEVVILDS